MDTLRVCRACLGRTPEENNLTSVFAVCTVAEFDQRTYSDLIIHCTNTQVKKYDSLPKNICNDCVAKLFISYNFKIQCEASYNYLLTCIPSLKPKLENGNNELKHEDPNELCGDYGDDTFFGDDKKKDIGELAQLEIPFLLSNGYCEDHVKTEITNKSIGRKLKPEKKKAKFRIKNKCVGDVLKEKQHIRKYSKRRLLEGGIKCRMCDVRYHFRYQIEKHERSHFHNKGYYCKMCDKNFHSEEFHKAYHLRMGTYECDDCGKIYKNRTGILNHLKIYHNGERPVFRCDFQGCEKSYNFQSSLANHRATHDNKRELLCELCSKTFLNRANLKVHMNCVHSDVKKFKCKECDSRFKTSSKLGFHFRSQHLGLKPHECQVCGKKFTQRNKLKRHEISVHIKDLRYECTVCLKRFSSPDVLRFHKRSVHGMGLQDTQTVM